MSAVAALAAAVGGARAAGRGAGRAARVGWYCLGAGCACWVLVPVAWLAGAAPLAVVGRVGFLGLVATGIGLAGSGPVRTARWRILLAGATGAVVVPVLAAAVGGRAYHLVLPLAELALSLFAGTLAVTSWAARERGRTAWFAGGLLALAVADLDAARGAGSAGLGWLVGFGCLALAGWAELRPAGGGPVRRSVIAELRPPGHGVVRGSVMAALDDQLRLANDLRDLPDPATVRVGPPAAGSRDPLGVARGALYEPKPGVR